MKRSINVIDLENRIQNNLNPSIKCKKETNEPKEEIKSTDRLTPKKQHPSYDDDIFKFLNGCEIKYNSDTLKNDLATIKKMDKISKPIGECNVPQEDLDFIRKNPDFIPSCIVDNIKDGNLN